MSFAKNMSKDVSSKYSQKLLGSDKKSTTDVIKTASKRVIQKTAEATGDLIGNKIADKISVSKSSASSQNDDANNEKKAPKKKDAYFQKKDNKLLTN